MAWLIGIGFVALGAYIRTKTLVIDKRGIRLVLTRSLRGGDDDDRTTSP